MSPWHLHMILRFNLSLQRLDPTLRHLDVDGEEVAAALMRPLLKQVDYQMVHTAGQQTHHTWRPGYVPHLHAAAEKAAERAGVISAAWEVAAPKHCREPRCARRGSCVCE